MVRGQPVTGALARSWSPNVNLPKSAHLWLLPYLRERVHRTSQRRPARRVWLSLTDHFEPMGGSVSLDVGKARMARWEERWPAIAAEAPVDSAGRAPCFTCFYPQEEYQPEILDSLARLAANQTLDVEVHLHHFNDNRESFREKVHTFTECLHRRHGLLHTIDGRIVFGFIHGNWALDNSHPEGFGCGVSGELQALRDLGCYADFTMPSLPSPTQARIVNQIYWTTGDPARPRGFDRGVRATVGGGRRGDLLMINGPAGLRFRDRLLPRLETGEIAAYDPPTADRVERWLDLAPRLGDDIFIKLYGHSAREDNAAALLGEGKQPGTLRSLFRLVHEAAARRRLELHWASAFQMFSAVDALLQPAARKTSKVVQL